MESEAAPYYVDLRGDQPSGRLLAQPSREYAAREEWERGLMTAVFGQQRGASPLISDA